MLALAAAEGLWMVVAAEVDPEPVFAGCLAVRYAAVGQDHPARWLVVGGACQQDPGQAQVAGRR